jgi:hypothetical protein
MNAHTAPIPQEILRVLNAYPRLSPALPSDLGIPSSDDSTSLSLDHLRLAPLSMACARHCGTHEVALLGHPLHAATGTDLFAILLTATASLIAAPQRRACSKRAPEAARARLLEALQRAPADSWGRVRYQAALECGGLPAPNALRAIARLPLPSDAHRDLLPLPCPVHGTCLARVPITPPLTPLAAHGIASTALSCALLALAGACSSCEEVAVRWLRLRRTLSSPSWTAPPRSPAGAPRNLLRALRLAASSLTDTWLGAATLEMI